MSREDGPQRELPNQMSLRRPSCVERPRNDRWRCSVWQEEPDVNGHRAMRGLITGRDVVLHAFTIIRLWGLPMYLRCLRATLSRRPTTFLAVVHACRG